MKKKDHALEDRVVRATNVAIFIKNIISIMCNKLNKN